MDAIELLGISPAAGRILRYFVVRPEARPHARELQRILGLGGASLQRELERMVRLRAVAKERDGRRTYYRVITDAPLWQAVALMVSTAEDPAALLRAALADVPGLDAAFVFGSVATGQQRDDSDIDVLIVENPSTVDTKRLFCRLAAVEMVLGRNINPVRYTLAALADRLGDPSHPAWGFVREVLSGAKRWIAGTPNAIAPVAVAAGLDRGELAGAAA